MISSASYHATEPDIIIAAITSNLVAATGIHDYILSDWATAGLRFPSAFKPVLTTLDPSKVRFTVGALSPHDLTQVERRLRGMLDL